MGARFSTSIDMADTAEAIVQRVEAFNWRDHKDSENWDMKAHMGIDPMLLGLSMELALKAWYAFDHDKLIKGHKLTKLFESLTPESQERLDAEFRRSVAPTHRNFFHVDYGIDKIFFQYEDAFIEWRYMHDKREKKTIRFEQYEVISTLRMMIAEFRERYKTIPYSVPNHFR